MCALKNIEDSQQQPVAQEAISDPFAAFHHNDNDTSEPAAEIIVSEVSLRKTVMENSARLLVLHKGDSVTLLGVHAGHCKIMLKDNQIGYVPQAAVGIVEGQQKHL